MKEQAKQGKKWMENKYKRLRKICVGQKKAKGEKIKKEKERWIGGGKERRGEERKGGGGGGGGGGVKSLSWKGRNNTTEAYSEIVGKDSNTSP